MIASAKTISLVPAVKVDFCNSVVAPLPTQ